MSVAAVRFHAAVSATTSCRSACGVCKGVGASAAVTRDLRVTGQEAEHGCLVDAVVWRGARVVAMFDDRVAPWS